MLLLVDGPLHPSKKQPSSMGNARKKIPGVTQESALCLLAVNKQIRDEAIGIYSANPLVFYYPTQFAAFFMDLGHLRRKVIKDITIHYDTSKRGGIELADVTFPLLRELVGLHRLRVLMNGTLLKKICRRGSWSTTYQMSGANPGLIPGLQVLFSLRGVTDIEIIDEDLNDAHKRARKDQAYPVFDKESRNYHIVKLTSALEHFNKALLEAQTGKVNHELFENNKWHTWDDFPEMPDEKEAEIEQADEDQDGQAVEEDEEQLVAQQATAVSSAGTRRSARISAIVAKPEHVIDYNEDNEVDSEPAESATESEDDEDDDDDDDEYR